MRIKSIISFIKTATLGIIGCLVALAASAQEIKLAKPTTGELAFQDLELGVFIHYSIDVYAERGAAHGATPASAFNPTELNAEQWVLAAKAMGAKFVVLTARHEEGFCLWPTKTADYSVKSSPYKNGHGDIVREFVDACRKYGLKVGLDDPPWIDSHWELSQTNLSPGREAGRIDKFDKPAAYAKGLAKEKERLRELMTDYGPLVFFWNDHYGRSDSIGTVPQGGLFRKFYAELAQEAHELQPNCLYFGPDVEHVGNEEGYSCYPMWNAVPSLDGTDYTISTTFKWNGTNTGNPFGKFYRPRLGLITDGFSTGDWMWTGPRQPQLLELRMQVFYDTIGRGASVIINLTPDRRGLIPDDLVTVAKETGDEIKRRFSNPIAQSTASDPVQTLKFDEPEKFDHIVTMEDLRDGQKIAKYTIEAQMDGEWKTVVQGQTIGHKRIDQFAPVTATAVRFTCTESLAQPVVVRSLALFNAGVKAP
jgi:alpha-L-fucosidase